MARVSAFCCVFSVASIVVIAGPVSLIDQWPVLLQPVRSVRRARPELPKPPGDLR